jgi:hypothetical protein
MATDPTKQVQDQVLDAIKRSQEAVIQAVSTWSETVGQLVPGLPDMPKMPLSDSLPKPSELSDQFFDFAQQMLNSQKDFVDKLVAALPGQHKSAPVPAPAPAPRSAPAKPKAE